MTPTENYFKNGDFESTRKKERTLKDLVKRDGS